ncbi:MAG: sugar phosphate isomerase/epimerase [Firmicutes bacterium]|nr:sugar phosphate isomerase/epimerase [Bacillota bacterium]
MANVGISTACLYPAETEKALESIALLGIKNIEIHFSTFSELNDGYLKELRKMMKHYGVRATSVHPFYCVLESPMFFSEYNERRFADGLEIYKQYFHATARLGAEYLVFHGGQKQGVNRCTVSDDQYIERYNLIFECAQKFGVTLLHENVYTHKCEDIGFCRKMIEYLGDKAQFTFDSKQARRSGYNSAEFAAALSGHICNIHISDFNAEHDCLLPGKGIENFAAIKNAVGSDADNICWNIEVYGNAINEPQDLELSAKYLQGALNKN